MDKFLKTLHYPLALLSLFSIKCSIFGASIGDAIAITALTALYGYSLYLDSKKIIPINDSIKAELEQIKSTINALKIAKSMGRQISG